MLFCCLGNKNDGEMLSDKDVVPDLTEIDTELGYNIELNKQKNNLEKEFINRLRCFEKKNVLINTVSQLIYNYKNNSEVKKYIKKKDRIRREILALKSMRN